MVEDYETCFIAGKNILERVAMAYEVIDQCKESKANEHLFKLDFEMAYDMVS